MRIVIAGGTGFLGAPLTRALRSDGHDVTVLSRRAAGTDTVRWEPDGSAGPWSRALDGAGAVVNLAGESIAGRRWTAARKQQILESRVLATRSIVRAIQRATPPPPTLINGSGIGYYGDRGETIVTEETGPGSDFLADVCLAWEAEAVAAERVGTRVVLVRTGIVLERDGGALAEMMRSFRFFVGGPLGSGRQYMPWIHRDDWIALVRFLLTRGDARGVFNASAPSPVTNEEFARALGRAMHRPAALRAPAFALKIVLGEMAEPLLLTGQRAVPARALALGFALKYPTLDEALAAIFA